MDVRRPAGAVRALLQLNVLLAAAASALTATAAIMVGAQPSWAAAVAAFTVVFGVYNFDRLADDTPAEGRSTPLRAATIRRVRSWLRLAIGVGLVVAVVLGILGGLSAVAWTVAFPSFGIAYVLPLFRGRKFRRLKDIPYLKTFYVAACWSIFVTMGVAFVGVAPGPATAWLAAFVALRAFVSASLADVRDIEDDRDAGVRTISVALGGPATYRLLYALHGCAAAWLILGVASGPLPALALSLLPPMLIGIGLQAADQRYPDHHELILELYDLEWMAYVPALWLGQRILGL